MEAQATCFISFIKLFSLLTKRKTIYEAHTGNSHNSETVKPHCLQYAIFLLHCAMKIHLNTNQNACNIQIIL